MKLSSIDRDYLQLCVKLHKHSHDPHRQVGSVIVGRDGQVLSEGVNAPPSEIGFSEAESRRAIEMDPDWKYFFLEHAERNAIHKAYSKNVSLKGATMYASLYPCADCARAIVAAGISRLVVPEPGGNGTRDAKWQSHYRYASQIFDLAGIEVDFESIPGDLCP